MAKGLKQRLESLYDVYNTPEYIDPDPLLFLYNYPEKKDREIAGLIAACLAYGQVAQIMKTVEAILGQLTPSPSAYLAQRTEKEITDDFRGFKYRFAKDHHITGLLTGIRRAVNRFSSLEDCFASPPGRENSSVQQGLAALFDHITPNRECGHLMADPRGASACKRSNLFLRWMVRHDGVDPGGWQRISPSQLIVPLDTHMYKTGILLGFTARKSRDMKTALEVTRGFQTIIPEDPVKYDFCLTRFGIRQGLTMENLKQVLLN